MPIVRSDGPSKSWRIFMILAAGDDASVTPTVMVPDLGRPTRDCIFKKDWFFQLISPITVPQTRVKTE